MCPRRPTCSARPNELPPSSQQKKREDKELARTVRKMTRLLNQGFPVKALALALREPRVRIANANDPILDAIRT